MQIIICLIVDIDSSETIHALQVTIGGAEYLPGELHVAALGNGVLHLDPVDFSVVDSADTGG